MKQVKVCECCGHKTTVYSHCFNATLASALKKFVCAYYSGVPIYRRPFNLQKDLDLTKNEYNNFQKLQYFGAVIKLKNGWIPTGLGVGFLNGNISLPKKVKTLNGEVLPFSHEAWVGEKYVTVCISDVLPNGTNQRPEFTAQAAPKNLFD